MNLVQFPGNIIDGSIHCLSPTGLNIIHCLCKMRVYRKAGFQLLDVLLLINKFLVGDNDRILFAIHGDRNGVVSG